MRTAYAIYKNKRFGNQKAIKIEIDCGYIKPVLKTDADFDIASIHDLCLGDFELLNIREEVSTISSIVFDYKIEIVVANVIQLYFQIPVSKIEDKFYFSKTSTTYMQFVHKESAVDFMRNLHPDQIGVDR